MFCYCSHQLFHSSVHKIVPECQRQSSHYGPVYKRSASSIQNQLHIWKWTQKKLNSWPYRLNHFHFQIYKVFSTTHLSHTTSSLKAKLWTLIEKKVWGSICLKKSANESSEVYYPLDLSCLWNGNTHSRHRKKVKPLKGREENRKVRHSGYPWCAN